MSHYLSEDWSPGSWFLTTDHKRIAILFLVTITGFFLIGGLAATLMRIELVTAPGDVVSADIYNRLFTLHGTVMVWLFLIPSIPTTLGNFLLPLMIGARDLAFPRLNLASWYVFLAGGFLMMWAIVIGGVDTGWTFYTPYSTTYTNSYVILMAAGVFIVGFSSIFSGLNFMVTTHTLRAPEMTWGKLPLFVWTLYATSLIMVLATPVLSVTLVLITAERLFGFGIFDPALGGDPLLFQHLFWFYSHPAVYIMILPGMGVISEILPCFARRPIFGYKFIAGSSLAIAVFGFLVWGHHMFAAGQSLYAGLIFSFLSFVVAVPSGVKVFSWTATLYKGSIRFDTPMLYALGFIGLFTIGGLTGLFLATLAVDVHLTDTYFVVAHFHFIMVGGMLMAYLGGLHFWWPKITGRLYREGISRWSAVLIFLGFNGTFLPQFLMGCLGMPRRYYAYPEQYEFLNVVASGGSVLLAGGYLLPLIYLGWSIFRGEKSGPNPWQATGLEWKTGSPPPKHNFKSGPPPVEKPYRYPLQEMES
jgi:cytochrome c oxidase subunit I